MHFLFGKLSDCVYLPQGCDFYIEKMTKKRMKIKRVIVAFLFCLSLTAVAQNQIKRVAILETVDKEGTVSYMKLLQFRSNLTTAITNTEGYEGYDRADLEQIIGEHNFQRTGLVSDADIKKIGEFTGAQYVLIAEAAIDGNHMFITAKIIDVETARILRNSNQLMGTSATEMQEGSKKVAAELLGVESGTSLSRVNKVGPMIQFDKTTIDFVDIKENGGKVTGRFTFKNVGDSPLIITDIKTGSLRMEFHYTDKPIEPGQLGFIDVIYDPWGNPGRFNRNFKVSTNEPNQTSPRLIFIKGNVIPCNCY